MKKIGLIAMMIAAGLLQQTVYADDEYPWLKEHYSVPDDTVSPNGRYGVMLPEADSDEPDKLVELKTGKVVAELKGNAGWKGGDYSMKWGDMEAFWSKDSSTLLWIFPGKWSPDSYVVLKLHGGKPAWQIELMHLAQMETLSRTEAAAPLNFAASKLQNFGDGGAYPEGFTIDMSEPAKFALPLVCDVSLTSNPKSDELEEGGVHASLTMTVAADGSVSFSDFEVERGKITADVKNKLKEAAKTTYPLIDTDLGKAMIFQKSISKDGRYAVGWTVRPVEKGTKAVDWSHWNARDPYTVLRHYDWGEFYADGPAQTPYEAVDFMVDLKSGRTLLLPTDSPYWTGKTDGWTLSVNWGALPDGRRFALVGNGQDEDSAVNYWLVNFDKDRMRVKDIAGVLAKSVEHFLGNKPAIIEYHTAKDAGANGTALIRFNSGVDAESLDTGAHGLLTLNPLDGTVTRVSNAAEKSDPFAANDALKQADARLNALYQKLLKSLPAQDVEDLKQRQREWIIERDDDAENVVRDTPLGASDNDREQTRGKSLLDSTNKRIAELEKWPK